MPQHHRCAFTTASFLPALVFAVATWMPVAVSAAEAQFNAEQLQRIAPRMQQFVEQGKIAGAVTLIATRDEVIHLEATGLADIDGKRRMEKDSIFRIASMTKPITATALMMLVAEGKLNVTDPVAKHIPSFANAKLKDGTAAREITIREVLTHTAGLSQPPQQAFEKQTLAQICEALGSAPLTYEPGTKWQYSSGLTIAGRLIEIASGETYEGYLRKHLFEPLGMKDTAFQLSAEQAKRVATNYQPGPAPRELKAAPGADPTQPRTPNPSGGLYSTAADQARFYQAVLANKIGDKKLLPDDLRAQMLDIQTGELETGFTPGNGWGLGWCVLRQPQGVTRLLRPGTYGHGGAWGTQGWTDPERGLIFVLMIQRSNFGNSDGSEIRDAFHEAALAAYEGTTQKNAKFAPSHGYDRTVELTSENSRVVLCPEMGGRVLEFSCEGKQALWFDEAERNRQPGKAYSSAGRFDFGPELTTAAHPQIWGGTWSAEITSERAARLTSVRDEASGVQLVRDFELTAESSALGGVKLLCTQTICNISDRSQELCHWGRSFSPGGGICLIPLAGTSRFPSKYAMYEDSAIINVRPQDEQIRERDGFLEILAPPRKPKLGFDSQAGWLAYLMPGNTLFVKRFVIDPERVYNEAAGLTASVWYPAGARIELEPIGPREKLAPGQIASFTEAWSLFNFPFPKTGEQVDLAAVRKLVEPPPAAR